MAHRDPVSVLVVMGVSGSGKTTIARDLATRLGWRYQEGDDLHPAANVEKMRNGIPLTDADRWPWLRAIAEVIDRWRARGEHGVVTSSALKRAYRDIIIGARPDVALLYLRGSKALIAQRLAARQGHYMPAALLDSQFATLEEPGSDERPIVVDIGPPPDEIVRQILVLLGRKVPLPVTPATPPDTIHGNTGERRNMWQPSERYPDPSVRILDPSFSQYRLPLASVERLAQGCRWSEGPVYFGDARCVLWSDIPNNRILRWDEATGAVSTYRQPTNNANGNTRDRQGRLVTCEHDTRRVTRTEYDGSITVLADSFDGKKLNSPNDVVVKSDGSIWFTDPVFGILGYYEGHREESEVKPSVYRIDGRTGQIAMVADDIEGPNGLAFSPDESKLYVVASRANPRKLVSYDVTADGTKLANGRTFIDAGPGTPDGFRVDVDGNLWCGWGMGDAELDGVRVFNASGAPIGHIDLPERCANVCFGGRYRNRLFMAASHSLFSLYVNTQGSIGG